MQKKKIKKYIHFGPHMTFGPIGNGIAQYFRFVIIFCSKKINF